MTIYPSPGKILTLSQMSQKKASTIQALFLDRELSGDQSATLNRSENPKYLAVATGLEKVNFHSNSRERQCQRMFKLLHNCTYFTC